MKKIMTLLMILALIACSRKQADSVKIIRVSNTDYGEIQFQASLDSCKINWTAYASEVNRGVIKQEAECPIPLEAQAPVLSELLLAVSKSEFSSFHTFFWGSLEDSPEMSARLALAAHRSVSWDKKTGKPVTGYENDFVVQVGNRERIYVEIEECFSSWGRKLALSSCEKVFVGQADRLPFYSNLRNQGVEPDEKLPYGGLIWFSVAAVQ